MEPHSEDGTHKLELPVSRTTLKDCGGVPMVISEKSAGIVRCIQASIAYGLTLSIQEVAHRHRVACLVLVSGGLLEHLIGVRLGADAHVLLTEVLDMSVDVGGGQLVRKRYLFQGKLVNTSACGAQQRRCGDDCAFHDCG